MKTLLVILNKGGVGKTTVVRTLGLEMARRGLNVVMIDTDPQGTLTESVGLPQSSGFYDWIAKDWEFTRVVKSVPEDVYTVNGQTPKGWVGVVPSNWESGNVAKAPVSPIIIRQRLTDAATLFDIDVVLIDPPPSESELHPWLVYSSDFALLPTQCLSESFNSLRRTVTYIQDHQAFRAGAGMEPTQIIGIQPTLFEPRGVIVQEEYLSIMKESYPNLLWDPICNRTDWSKAAAYQRSIFSQAPDSYSAEEADGMLKRVINAIGLTERLAEAENG